MLVVWCLSVVYSFFFFFFFFFFSEMQIYLDFYNKRTACNPNAIEGNFDSVLTVPG